MSGEELFILKLVGGFLSVATASSVVIYKVWIAQIQKDNDKLVELRLEADGSKQLTIKGYSREDQAKICRQLTNSSVVDFQLKVNGNGKSTISKTLKS